MSTTPDESATIAIVASGAFDYGQVDLDAEFQTPAGNDLATFIVGKLVKAGAKCLVEPVFGEEGWTFDVEVHGDQYRVFVHWAPIGRPPTDRWVIQPDVRKPLLRSLFGRKTANQEVQPLVRELRRVLESSAEIDEVNWISKEEFASMY